MGIAGVPWHTHCWLEVSPEFGQRMHCAAANQEVQGCKSGYTALQLGSVAYAQRAGYENPFCKEGFKKNGKPEPPFPVLTCSRQCADAVAAAADRRRDRWRLPYSRFIPSRVVPLVPGQQLSQRIRRQLEYDGVCV